MNGILMLFGFGLLLAVLANAQNAPMSVRDSCSAHSSYNNVGNSYYNIFTKKSSWIEAAHNCRSYNNQLASLKNGDEQQELSNFLSRKYRQVFWLSGNDLGVEGTFKWLGTGKEITNLTSFDWGNNGRPSASNTSANCVSLKWEQSGFKLNVEDCEMPYYFICQASVVSFFNN